MGQNKTYRILPKHSSAMKILLCTVLLLFNYVIHAQQISLTGTIQDEKTATALEGASIALFNAADSSLITGAITKKDGVFVINKLNSGNYYLLIKSVGYQSKEITDLNLTNIQKANLGIIALIAAENMMQVVTVSAFKMLAQNLLDKQVYKADQFVNARGGTATDILKNLPAVSVNSLGEISVRGQTGFQVQLNGKPVRADVETILSQVAANDIDNIELKLRHLLSLTPMEKPVLSIL